MNKLKRYVFIITLLIPALLSLSCSPSTSEEKPEKQIVPDEADMLSAGKTDSVDIEDPAQIPLNEYIWDDMNMFFGWSIIGKDKIDHAKDLDMKWASLQPHVIWFEIEAEKGIYDWSKLDEEIMWLQALDVDITLVYSTFCNIFDETLRQKIRLELLELVKQPDIATLSDAWISWNRDMKGPALYDLEPDPFDENDEMMTNLIEFTRALTERYDGDGIDDFEYLKYPLRVHHIVEEWPSPGLNTKTYLGFLVKLSEAIKEADPDARIMIPGLYMPNWGRVFAYLDGYIDHPDAGIVNGVLYSKEELSQMKTITYAKASYESILKLGKDYFDIVDIHLYTELEAFYEGEIDYIINKMREYGYEKPIWCVEGGGPFRNPENSPGDPQGDTLFGTTNEKEVAEYVVKYHAMSAAKGLVRQHWGIGGQKQHGYWGGPWNIMGLVEKVTEKKRPAYYTYKLMREKLRDFKIGNVIDKSAGTLRVFEFNTPEGPVYVAWNSKGNDLPEINDLSSIIGNNDIKITGIVTELNRNNNPVLPKIIDCSPTAVPIGITPVFMEPSRN